MPSHEGSLEQLRENGRETLNIGSSWWRTEDSSSVRICVGTQPDRGNVVAAELVVGRHSLERVVPLGKNQEDQDCQSEPIALDRPRLRLEVHAQQLRRGESRRADRGEKHSAVVGGDLYGVAVDQGDERVARDQEVALREIPNDIASRMQ